ncbi:MAG TPA: efflux RND transporter periplasmic adaptor subunit [Caldithrix abyssi]|uniref:Efflux RND transporter periplasmic adaptor subunit n=1 Tax=Caldithrix abyssi TaxID=187145 RepID=A0A7V4U1S3_CALAY|nr:efflux RND transporter periplasmic adaptor subunit [Caldithrix abyssi]
MRLKYLLIIGGLLLTIAVFSGCSSDTEKEENTAQASSETTNQLWTCGMHPEVILDEPGQCPKCGMDLVPLKQNTGTDKGSDKSKSKSATGERKILYWQAPMNPTEIYDRPGKSKMGMDLIPVYEDQVSSGSSIQIDPVTVQNMGVRTAHVQRIDFSRTIRTVAKVDYNEEKLYTVSSKISGWIEKLYVDYTGKPVRKGQTLLEIYSPELVTTQQEYLLALKNQKMVGESKFASVRDGAQSLLNASRQRLLYWDIPESEINRLQETGVVRKTLRLNSPASGVVIHKNAIDGMFVKEGKDLYQIADLSTVWVLASIYDNEAPWVRTGQTAKIELPYVPGKTLEGKITYIYPYLDEKARDLKIRLEFPNPGLQLKPGMYTNVLIQTPPIKDALVVPVEAVIRSGRRNLVFIAREGGRFEPREVNIGEESDDGKIRIIGGLLGDEEIVISAQFLLDSESRLQEAIQKMLAEKAGKAQKETKKETDMDKSPDKSVEDQEDHSTMEMDQDNSGNEDHDHSTMNMEKDEKPAVKKQADSEMKCGEGKCGGY